MKILAIGAHPDDIEIGCGGTLAAHVQAGDVVRMVVMSGGEGGGASAAVRLKEMKDAAQALGVTDVVCFEYPDTQVPEGVEVIHRVEEIVNEFHPDRVYIPYWHEVHQDHRRTSETALAACRNVPQILMYEGPSTFPDFTIGYFSDISQTLEKKVDAIRCHASQGEKEILKIDAIVSLNRFRGYQARAMHAEGFAIFRFIENVARSV